MNLITPLLIPPEAWNSELSGYREKILLGLGSLGHGFPPALLEECGTALEVVNSYYSNRMEGNPTKIADVFDASEGKATGTGIERDYKLEHVAHIKAAEAMKARLKADPQLSPVLPEFITFLHQRFYESIPDSLRFALTESGKKVPVIPGSLRTQMVSVGNFTPPAPEQVEECLHSFSTAYDPHSLEADDRLIALAAQHHRFLYIHPFSDGNGRVARLLTEAIAQRLGYGAHGLYSISRGLARNRKDYDRALAAADKERLHSTDGRGGLSLRGLVEFCTFFLSVMWDQIDFMGGILDRKKLEDRLETFLAVGAVKNELSDSEAKVVRYLFKVGEMTRGEVSAVAGVGERQSNKIVARLLEKELARSPSPKGRLFFAVRGKLRRTLFEEFFLAD